MAFHFIESPFFVLRLGGSFFLGVDIFLAAGTGQRYEMCLSVLELKGKFDVLLIEQAPVLLNTNCNY
jgi:hypothetical protein